MSKKGRGNVNRLLNPHWASARDAGWKLWDRQGRLWEPVALDLDRDRVKVLFDNPAVPVAIAEAASTMSWVEPADRKRRWHDDIERRAFDPGWTWEAEHALPFTAIEFGSGPDRLLLFYDND